MCIDTLDPSRYISIAASPFIALFKRAYGSQSARAHTHMRYTVCTEREIPINKIDVRAARARAVRAHTLKIPSNAANGIKYICAKINNKRHADLFPQLLSIRTTHVKFYFIENHSRMLIVDVRAADFPFCHL